MFTGDEPAVDTTFATAPHRAGRHLVGEHVPGWEQRDRWMGQLALR